MDESRLTISIVIPVYNEETRISACLDAIAAQSIVPDEVIVVDNNSTDKTVVLAKGYPFVRVVHEKRRGVTFASITGFNVATSDLIGRIDADSHLSKDWTSTVLQYFANPTHSRTIIAGSCSFYNLRFGSILGRIYCRFMQEFLRMVTGHYFPWGSNSVLPRDVWKVAAATVCHRDDIYEDLDLGIHAHRLGYKIRFLPKLGVGAEMRRVLTNHNSLWSYLSIGPRMLKRHGIRRAVLSWGLAYVAWSSSYIVLALQKIGHTATNRSHI